MKHSYRAVDSTEFTAFSISKGMFMNLLKYKGKHPCGDYAAEPKVNPHY